MPTWLDLPQPWVFLAPMAGVSEWAFREVCYDLGAEIAVSPQVPAQCVAASPRRVLPTFGAAHGGRPFLAQLLGKQPEEFRRAARLITDELPVAGIDVNMGCPAAQVVGAGHGSALLRQPELAAEIVAATCAGTHLPVSVKLRVGWDSVTAPELAPRLAAAGARALVVHGRTREQQYAGVASLEAIAATRAAVRIPVVGNGDVVSLASARRLLAETGAAGVMVGRGAVGRPWLFAELQAGLKGGRPLEAVDGAGAAGWRGKTIRRLARLTFASQGRRAALTLRKHLVAYTRGHPASAQLRRALEHLSSPEEVEEWLREHEAALSP